MHVTAEDAIQDNAAWCDLVCRTHGLTGAADEDAWSVPRRSPTWYPDAVTLRRDVDPAALLDRIDAGPGASVKDSYADLDLSPYGFRILVDADWIRRPPDPDAATMTPPDAAPSLTPVTTPEALAAWAAAHGGGELFRPALLTEPRVTVLARLDGGVVAGGAILHRWELTVGVSNVFARTVPPEEIWAALPATAPLVGYESGDDLAIAVEAGFRRAGPLRVWLRD
ncbi:hypothetical protein [Micromonospora thermarum]|uniref:GCN5-related N-acetyltransferase n=1 Tax=Micromonospora thermarum TaxID=2720024 RepID=A0ABX0ZBT5_9ACTN|nr:hypothetical protein [Micromonospora thermarum]NJP34424.1 hypothetical protein [Micromonospora thermarum]